MAKKKSKKNGKAVAAGKAAGGKAAKAKATEAKEPKTPKAEKAAEPKVTTEELDALRKPVEEVKGRMEKAQAGAKALAEKARGLVAEAKDAYRAALAPYREACHRAGVECEYEGGRSANVSVKVCFLVEKTDLPAALCDSTAQAGEVIPPATLKDSINKAAYAYTRKWLGPKEESGNKGGSLSNRLRAVLA